MRCARIKIVKFARKRDCCDTICGSLVSSEKINLNYSWISIRPNNCTMSSKIDSGSSNYSEIICQKGIKSLWQFLEELFSCQGSLIVAIPAVHTVCWYLPAFHKTHFCRGSCYTAWMWYIFLSGLLLQQSSAVLNGRYQYAV